MLRFLHAVLIGDALKFGPFKLRGVEMQFEAAMVLYRLFAEHAGKDEIPEDKLHWALHDLLVALLQPESLGDRAIDCPIDQMLFLWALLPNGHYRIAESLQVLLSGCKYGFRCTAIHLARVEAHKQQQDKLVTFYGSLLAVGEAPAMDGQSGNSSADDQVEEIPEGNMAQLDVASTDMATILTRLRNMTSPGQSFEGLFLIDIKLRQS